MHYGLYLSVVLLKLFLCIMMILMNWYENILKFEYIEVVINVFIRKKFLRLTMGFGYFMYSHSLVPVIDLWVRVVTKLVSEQWFHCWSLNCHFMFSCTTAVLGCQMSVLSSLLPVFFVVSVCLLCLILLSFLLWLRSREKDAPTTEVIDKVEESFEDEALAPAPRRRERGSSDREVLSHVVYVLGVIFMIEIVGLIISYCDC